jgi:hypothetical protein
LVNYWSLFNFLLLQTMVKRTPAFTISLQWCFKVQFLGHNAGILSVLEIMTMTFTKIVLSVCNRRVLIIPYPHLLLILSNFYFACFMRGWMILYLILPLSDCVVINHISIFIFYSHIIYTFICDYWPILSLLQGTVCSCSLTNFVMDWYSWILCLI